MGRYTIPGGTVEYLTPDVIREISDLYAVAEEDAKSGSSNLGNDILRQMLSDVLAGKNLSAVQWTALNKLRDQYASAVKAHVAAGRDGQDYFGMADGRGAVHR